ncbi:hypothetical protein D3C85_1684530 [compost metagenome]
MILPTNCIWRRLPSWLLMRRAWWMASASDSGIGTRARRSLARASSSTPRSCSAVMSRLRCDLLLGRSSSGSGAKPPGKRELEGLRVFRVIAGILSCYDSRLDF